MAIEYYVFDSEQDAIDANNYIGTFLNFPWKPTNSETGENDDQAQQTTTWSRPLQRDSDNKWILNKLPDTMWENATEEQKNHFNTTFQHTTETYASNWFNRRYS